MEQSIRVQYFAAPSPNLAASETRSLLIDLERAWDPYITRVVGGGIAIGVYRSKWLRILAPSIFTSLALIKRYSELMVRQGAGLATPADRDYGISDLQIAAAMAVATGMSAITVFSLYLSSPTVAQLYSRPWMSWLLNPLLLCWIGRALMLAHRQAMPDNSIVCAFKDNAGRIVVLAMICIVLAAI